MKRIRVQYEFKIESDANAGEVFEMLANALTEAEDENNQLEDTDVFSSKNNFTISIVGKGESLDAASKTANRALVSALQSVEGFVGLAD